MKMTEIQSIDYWKEWLIVHGYSLDFDKDGLWAEDWIQEHKWNDIFELMSQYASEREAKWRELVNTLNKISNVDYEYYLVTMALEADINPYSKRYREQSKNQDRLCIEGNELRQSISELEKELL